MRRLLFLALLSVWMALPVAASAQGDVDLGPPSGGLWELYASWPPEADTTQVCAYREDTSEELGCTTGPPQSDANSPTGQSVRWTVAVTTPTPPAEVPIRAYALDDASNRSADSPNRAFADFLPPGAPAFLASVLLVLGLL